MAKKSSLISNFSIVSLWTLFSRILGFLRDIFLALYLGSGPIAQAFLLAFTIPNMLRRIFAEGSFNKVFIPIFVGVKRSERDARKTLHTEGYPKFIDFRFSCRSFLRCFRNKAKLTRWSTT